MPRRSLRDTLLGDRGCETSALAPPARTKSVSPNLRSLRALPDWAERDPLRFCSCSPSPGLADGQGFMRGLCAEPLQPMERDMSDRTKIAAASRNLILVPLNK